MARTRTAINSGYGINFYDGPRINGQLRTLTGSGSYTRAALKGGKSYTRAALKGGRSYTRAALKGGRSYTRAALKGGAWGDIIMKTIEALLSPDMKKIWDEAISFTDGTKDDLLKNPTKLLKYFQEVSPKLFSIVKNVLTKFGILKGNQTEEPSTSEPVKVKTPTYLAKYLKEMKNRSPTKHQKVIDYLDDLKTDSKEMFIAVLEQWNKEAMEYFQTNLDFDDDDEGSGIIPDFIKRLIPFRHKLEEPSQPKFKIPPLPSMPPKRPSRGRTPVREPPTRIDAPARLITTDGDAKKRLLERRRRLLEEAKRRRSSSVPPPDTEMMY